MKNGDFYVADGYCNSRILKFNSNGIFLQIIGKAKYEPISLGPVPPNQFGLPHDIKLSANEKELYVVDRENGRVQAFSTEKAAFLRLYKVPEFGFRVFSIDVAGENTNGLF